MSRKDLLGYLCLTALLSSQSILPACAETLPIKKISVDASKQLVVEFGGTAGSFPSVPHVLDLPGPNHRVVLDFTDATLDKAALQADSVSSAVQQALPFVKNVRYSNLENAPSPTARIVLDVPEGAKFKPHVVKLEAGTIIVSLGDELPGATASAAPEAPLTAAAADAATHGLAPDAVAEVASPKPGETPIGEEAPSAPSTTHGGDVVAAAIDDLSKPAATEAAAAETTPAPADTTPTTTETAPSAAPVAETTPAPTTEPVATTPAAEATPVPVEAAAAPVSAAAPTPASSSDPGPEALAPAADAPAPAVASPVVAAPPATAESSEADKKLAAVRHYNEAVKAHLSGKLSDAISEYKAALESNSSLAEAHSNLGLIFNQQHNYAGALSEFRKALAINPKDAITYNGIGAALRAERDLQGAIKNWQTAVSLDPKLATAHYNLGTAYEIEKEYDKALDSYKNAVGNDYRLGEAYYRMGLIWERKHHSDDAATQFQEALKISGDSEYSEDARQRLAFLTKGGAKTKTK